MDVSSSPATRTRSSPSRRMHTRKSCWPQLLLSDELHSRVQPHHAAHLTELCRAVHWLRRRPRRRHSESPPPSFRPRYGRFDALLPRAIVRRATAARRDCPLFGDGTETHVVRRANQRIRPRTAGLSPLDSGSVAALVHGLAADAANPGGPVRALGVAHAIPGVVAGLLARPTARP